MMMIIIAAKTTAINIMNHHFCQTTALVKHGATIRGHGRTGQRRGGQRGGSGQGRGPKDIAGRSSESARERESTTTKKTTTTNKTTTTMKETETHAEELSNSEERIKLTRQFQSDIKEQQTKRRRLEDNEKTT